MEKKKINIADFFQVEFNKEYLLKNWPRLTVLSLLLLAIVGGLAFAVLKATEKEKMVRVEVTLKKVCRLGGELMLEQRVVREVVESQLADAPREISYLGLCDRHLYEMSVRREEYGRSRFYDDVAQVRAVGVEYTVSDEHGRERTVAPDEDEMAHRLIKVLVDKYPQAQHYDIRVNHTHYDFNRDGVLLQKYD